MRNLVLIFVVGIVFFLAPSIGLSPYLHPLKWTLFAFFLTISYLNYVLMNQAFAQNREKFIVFSLASMVGRLILSLVFVGVMVLIETPNRRLFVLNFFALYLLFTSFEVWSNLANLRRFSGGDQNNKQ